MMDDTAFELDLQVIQSIENILNVKYQVERYESSLSVNVRSQREESDASPSEIVQLITSLLPHPELLDAIRPVLELNNSNEELQSALFDILGMEGFDLIEVLVTQRQKIVQALDANDNQSGISHDDLNRPLFSSDYGQYRKQKIKYPHVYGNQVNQPDDIRIRPLKGNNFAAPQGTIRRNTEDYEEYKFPMGDPITLTGNDKLVKIDQLEKWTHPVFQGYKSLNKMQSLVYPTAYFTNENILVCAPTSAGKTDVAMLTILSIVRQYITEIDDKSGRVQIAKNDFKMVYVAPMKALATEITRKFSSRLGKIGLQVKEWTGDTQLSQKEINETNFFVVTPEKWDVVTRKTSSIDSSVIKLLLIDEVHLLHDERGAVIETLVARTQRLVESSQSMIRIVGLSATLPNYVDVAEFLCVNPMKGMFFFDQSFRPVPLQQTIVGIKSSKGKQNDARAKMNDYVYEKVIDVVKQERQAMVFVHSRKDTVKTGEALVELAQKNHDLGLFEHNQELKATHQFTKLQIEVSKSRNKELKQLFAKGVGIHHAGMLRQDRLLVEKLFQLGFIKVLVCTATLAWGVNLPAYTCIIKGTQVYDSEKGTFVDLSILDVLQIFGRAGRPQFEPNGVAYLLTTHDKLAHYMMHLSMTYPIESQFTKMLVDNLNAEICATGSITNLDEAAQWLGYTYWFTRCKKVPELYGFRDYDPRIDPRMLYLRKDLIKDAAKTLHNSQLIIYDESTGSLSARDSGRIAASFYLKHESMDVLHEKLTQESSEADILEVLVNCEEFDGIKVREEELKELQFIQDEGYCPNEIKSTIDTVQGKLNVLIQAYISRYQPDNFTLISDMGYLAQNIPRILRATLEYSLRRKWSRTSMVILDLCKSSERRIWSYESPLGQFVFQPNSNAQGPGVSRFKSSRLVTLEEFRKIDNAEIIDMDSLRGLNVDGLTKIVNHPIRGQHLHNVIKYLPYFQLDVAVVPVMADVLQIIINVKPDFVWNDKYSGAAEPFWLFIEDLDQDEIYISKHFVLTKDKMDNLTYKFYIPVRSELPKLMYLKMVSDRWSGVENIVPITFDNLEIPHDIGFKTKLLDLHPLQVSALNDSLLQSYFEQFFSYFDPVMTQMFHSIFHQKKNLLICSSQRQTIWLSMHLSVLSCLSSKVKQLVYIIVPNHNYQFVKSLLSDLLGKLYDQEVMFCKNADSIKSLKHGVLIFDMKTADQLVQNQYQIPVNLILMLNCHLWDEMQFDIAKRTSKAYSETRVVALCAPLYNPFPLSSALGIGLFGTFNFRPQINSTQIQIEVAGFPGAKYISRMNSMNKPILQSIMKTAMKDPVIIYVSSRKQLLSTSKSIISLCASTLDNPKQFLNMDEKQLEDIVSLVQDQNIKFPLAFGFGLYHENLSYKDKQIVLELYESGRIQVLLATFDSCHELNTFAKLVIVKGFEKYDQTLQRYSDTPIGLLFQMMYNCGREQDDDANFHLMVHESKKGYLNKFLSDGLPLQFNSKQNH